MEYFWTFRGCGAFVDFLFSGRRIIFGTVALERQKEKKREEAENFWIIVGVNMCRCEHKTFPVQIQSGFMCLVICEDVVLRSRRLVSEDFCV